MEAKETIWTRLAAGKLPGMDMAVTIDTNSMQKAAAIVVIVLIIGFLAYFTKENSMMLSATQFIAQFENAVIEATAGTGIFPSVKMAQAALETGWGKSLSGNNNNMFGIKAAGIHTPYWTGGYVIANTSEVIGGITGKYNLAFRKYASVSDSIRDHSYFLTQNSRYEKVFTAATPEAQAQALQAAGYATDPGYAGKLISVINQYGLKRLDLKKKG